MNSLGLIGLSFQGHKASGALMNPSARTAEKGKKGEKAQQLQDYSSLICESLDPLGRDGHLAASGHCRAVCVQ